MFRLAAKVLSGGAEFTFMETDAHTKAATRHFLEKEQRIPIKTWGWRQEWIEIDTIETYGVEGNATEEPGWAQEIRDRYGEVDLDTGVEQPGPTGRGVGKTTVRVWSFFCKHTQAYYARMALEQENYKLLKIPRSANNPQRSSQRQGTSALQTSAGTRKKRGKAKKRKRPGRL